MKFERLEVETKQHTGVMGGGMQPSTIPDSPVVVYRISGEVFQCSQMNHLVEEVMGSAGYMKNKSLILDLEGVYYINSTGLSALMGLYKRLMPFNVTVAVVNLQRIVEKIFFELDLFKVIRRFDDLEKALATLAPDEDQEVVLN